MEGLEGLLVLLLLKELLSNFRKLNTVNTYFHNDIVQLCGPAVLLAQSRLHKLSQR